MNNSEEDDPFKFYFQIDTEWIKKYVENIIDNMNKLPVNSSFPSIAEGITSLYLGNNYYDEGVWKIKYFIYNKLQKEYELHLQSHAGYFLSQPRYYKGLYEILN